MDHLPGSLQILVDIESAFNHPETAESMMLQFEDISSAQSGFEMYLYKEDRRIELADIGCQTKPHLHNSPGISYIRFLDDNGEIGLGGYDQKGQPYIAYTPAIKGSPYLLPPYVIHSVRTRPNTTFTRVLILNQNPRPRQESGYTPDSYFPQDVKMTYYPIP